MYQQKQLPSESAAANLTHLSTKVGENTSEVLLEIFYRTEKTYSDLTENFPVQSDRVNSYILVDYHYDANNIITTPLKNKTGTCILSGITKIYSKIRKRGLRSYTHVIYVKCQRT